MSCRSLALVAAAAVLLPRLAAAAEPSARQTADTLFRDGRAAMERADYATACPLLARSQELDPAGGTLLNLALCHEKQGKLVAALSDWKQAAERNRVEKRAEREREALVHLADLEARVPHVTFTALASGLSVSLDGQPIAAPTPAAPTHLRLDPGTHTVRTELPGREPVVRTFELTERVPSTIDLQEPTAEIAVPAGPLAAESLPMMAGPVPLPPEPHAHLSLPSKVLIGTAAAAGAAAAITGVLAVAARLSYTSSCIDARAYCSNLEAVSTGERARTMAWVSTATTGVAFAALWTALLLPRHVVLTPRTAAALSLGGEF